MKRILSYLLLYLLVGINPAYSKEREYLNQIELTVKTWVELRKDGKFNFAYEIFSGKNSKQQVKNFGVVTREKVSLLNSPTGWTYFDTTDAHPNCPKFGHWAATDFLIEPPEDENDPLEVPKSPYQIKPGGSEKGFGIRSEFPSGIIKFYAEGWVPLRSSEEELEEPEDFNHWDHVYWGEMVGPVKSADPTLKGLIPRLKELLVKAKELKWVDTKIFPQFLVPLELILSTFAKKGNSSELIKFIQDYLKLFDGLKASLDPNFYFLMVPNLEYILLKIGEETK